MSAPSEAFAHGRSWLIRLGGDERARRAQLVAIGRLDGFAGVDAFAAGARVPRYVGWPLAAAADIDACARRVREIGADAVVDCNL